MATTREHGASAAGLVLLTLATGQFLMTLDSSVMNVSIATVAKDMGTADGDHKSNAARRWLPRLEHWRVQPGPRS